MRTLIIGKVWPEPDSSAAGARTMGLIDAFREVGWPVTFASSAQPTAYSVNLNALGVSCEQIAVNDALFDQWVSDLNPALVIFDRFMTEEQFGWRVERACPAALRILDTSDLHCLREAREEELKKGGGLDLLNGVALREVASIFRSDLSLMISEVEIDILQKVFQVPAVQLSYLPLMLGRPNPNPLPYESRKHFVMIGSYLHAPNWDAVQWCCESIWPLIRKALPEAELHIYGSYEPNKARQLSKPELGLLMRGRAESALDMVGRYRVNLAPLRFGAGQKGKVADGFCAGTPNVVTPIAAESMHGEIDWGCAISAEQATYAETAIQVYTEPEQWKRVQGQGYKIVIERLLASDWRSRLIETLRALSLDRRHEQFVGRMLRHHQHRSTEFMSRWIEAKNRLSERSDL